MPNRTLTEFVKGNPRTNRINLVGLSVTTLDQRRDYPMKVLDVAEGLDYLHANHIIHGNLNGAGGFLGRSGHH